MAQKVLIMGESGTGKSTSLRNCDPATTAVINPVGKPLPFKNHFEMLNNETDARKIVKYMKEQCAAGKKGDTVDLIVDGVEVMKVITREEFNAGIKRLAQENNTVPADAQTPAEPLDGAMNPPEQHVRGQRRRRTRS